MQPEPVPIDAAALARVVDQQAISDVVYRYCRGIDRRDFELVRGCYHPDAVDDHGDFRGGVDDFVAFVQSTLPRFERTMHFIGNVLVEPDGDVARAESYAVAYHRLPERRGKPERDLVAGFRYVDDFERRGGEWRIATRVCAYEWARLDPVPPGGWVPPAAAVLGHHGAGDVVFAPSLATWQPPA